MLPTLGQLLVSLCVGVEDIGGLRTAHMWERSQTLGISVPALFLPSNRIPIFIQLSTPFLYRALL